MKKRLLFFITMLIITSGAWAQVVTTAAGVTICTGPSTVQIPVKVGSFTAVGSISLKLSYVNAELTAPSVVYKDPGLTAWGTFQTNMTTPGTIIISAYDPDVTAPIPGLTLADSTILFTLQFNIGTITTPAILSFIENSQGNTCEYGGVGPNYTPFNDTPTGTYYKNGRVTIVADPVAPGLTKSPADANVCAGQNLTVTISAGSGGTGTIADEYSYSTNNGSSWSGWLGTIPSFAAITGTNLIRSRRTADGTGCNESPYNTVSWNVVADPVAPGLTKSPADANVCAGQNLTVTISAGSGGTGTIADEYSFSTNNGSSWSAWLGTIPSFAAITGTNLIRSRRTATGTGCNESPYISVSWNVVADPVAPGITKNPPDASICAGETLTVTISAGSGGTGTITDEYRYSTDGGTYWSVWNTAVPSFAGIAGTNLIQSRRTATGTGCDISSPNQVSWIVNAKQKISGTFNYYRFSGDVLLSGADITVKLYKSSDLSHTTLLGTDVTDASGYYEFNAICPACDYDIVATSTHQTDGAINTTDAAKTNFWGVNPYSIEKVMFHAGDASGPDLFLGGTDAGRIQENFVLGTDLDGEPWTFWRSGFSILHNPLIIEPEYTEYYPKVTLAVGSDFDADMYGLVTGDFNRSFNPNVTKSASSTLDLVYDGNLLIGAGQDFDLPVKMVNAGSIGAVSLILIFPDEFVEVKDVLMDGAGGQLNWAVKGNELRIGWHSPVPVDLKAGAGLLSLRLKTTPGFTIGNSIRISLAADPLNELADAMYDVIGNAVLSVEAIDATALGINDASAEKTIAMNCYPNPFSNFTRINYTLPFEGKVILVVSNLVGVKVAVLVSETQPAGDHSVKFDTNSLPEGVYTATLRLRSSHDEMIRTIKLINNR